MNDAGAAIERTEAIVLRVAPFSETSHVVTWLTPSRGKITTLVKGAQRPKSAFLGQYDLFYTCELLFYERDHGGLHIARECAPLKVREGFRTAWAATAVASYACDLVQGADLGGASARDLYGFLEEMLDWLPTAVVRPAAVFWFETQLLRIDGVQPRFDRCGRCGARHRDGAAASLAPNHDLLLCLPCAETDARAGSAVPVKADAMAILRAWSVALHPPDIRNTILTREQTLAFARLFGMLLGTLLGVKTVNRSFALDAMVPG